MATVLSNFGAPTINSVAAQRVLSNTLLDNVYQGLIEKNGEGVTQKYTDDTSGAEIRILHVKPTVQVARELGAMINGGNFNSDDAVQPETDSIGLRVLTTLDKPIDIANVTLSMIPVDLAAAKMKDYSNQVNVNINAMTVAGKYFATFEKAAKDASTENVNITTYTSGTNLRDAIMAANSLLDDGQPEMGITIFPQIGRCYVMQTSYRTTLMTTGVFVIGGANYAYDMQAKGVISPGAEPRKLEDGYIGILDDVPCHIMSTYIFNVAAQYLGIEAKDVKHVVGYVSSDIANVRALAAPRDIKVIDCPRGAGITLQPITRMGFKVLDGYEKGNSFIVDSTFSNVYTGLNTLFSLGGNYDNYFTFIGAGSRVKIAATAASSAATKVTITSALASKIAIVAVASTTTINSVTDFLAAYTAAGATAKAADAVSGTEKTLAGATAGMVAYGLAMAADGTCVLCHVTVAS